MKRRIFLAFAAGMALLPRFVSTQSGSAVPKGTDMDAIARGPELPSAGNPQGDVTIAAFSDYNCPFCKAAERNLDRLVRDDGNVRLVYKDWPILSSASIYGARLALAAKYQEQCCGSQRADGNFRRGKHQRTDAGQHPFVERRS